MLIQDLLSNNFVDLAPTRYEFAEVVGDVHDDNWLIITETCDSVFTSGPLKTRRS
jgi:hypothetical protein